MPDETGSRQKLLSAAVEHFARHGIGDQSLRQIAVALETNHRKLIYHFGSKQGLLAAVVDTVERDQRRLLAELLSDETIVPHDAALEFWRRLIEPVRIYGGLFFELSGQAIQGQPHALALRHSLIDIWLEPLTELATRAGWPQPQARAHARLSMATARGLFLDLLITGDQEGVEDALALYAETYSPGR